MTTSRRPRARASRLPQLRGRRVGGVGVGEERRPTSTPPTPATSSGTSRSPAPRRRGARWTRPRPPSPPGATRPRPCAGAILFRAQAILDKEKDELARLLTREEGKTVKEALGEIQRIDQHPGVHRGRGPAHGRRDRAFRAARATSATPCASRWASWPASRPGTSRWPSRSGRSRPRWSAATRWSSSPPPSPRRPRPPWSPSSSAPGVPKGVLNMVLGSGGTVGNALARPRRGARRLLHRQQRGGGGDLRRGARSG